MLPIIIQYSATLVSLRHSNYALVTHLTRALKTAGVNSTVTSSILVGLASQLWLRQYHPGWYRKYNYILGGALDGGAQIMIFILSFAVFGASGVSRPFPSVS
jgi:OPT oligopeptide transporter protein